MRHVVPLAALLLAAAPAPAQVVYSWAAPAPADFGAPSSWSPPGPPGPADVAQFSLAGARAVLSDSRTNLRLVATNAADMEIALATGVGYTATATGTTATDSSLVVGRDAGTAALTLRATGSVLPVLSRVNTVNAIVGGAGTGALTLAADAGSGGLQWNNSGNLTVSASSNGTLAIGAGSRVTVGGNTQIGILSSRGSTTVRGAGAALTVGALLVDGFDTLTVDNGGTLTSGATQVARGGGVVTNPVVTIGPGGTWNANGMVTIGNGGSAIGEIDVSGGTLTVAPGSSVIMDRNGTSIKVTAGGQVKVGTGSGNSPISGTGSATLNVSGAGSTLTADSIGMGSGNVIVSGGGTIVTGSYAGGSSRLTIGGGGTLVAGSGFVQGTQNTTAGTLRVTAGSGPFLVFGGVFTQTGPAVYQTDAGATLNFQAVTLDLGSTTATFDGAGTAAVTPAPPPNDFALGVIQGTGGIVKNGPGTLTLGSPSTYSGGTTVNAGTLLVTNAGATSATGTGPVTVNGGVLGGTGRIGGPVTVGPNGTVAPGVGPGTLTAAVDVLIGGGLNWEVGDRLAVGGRLTLDPATSALNVSGTLDGTTTYTVATFTDPAAPGPFALVRGLPGNYFVDYSLTAIRLAPVPEPSALALCGLAAAGGLARRRRRAAAV